MRYLVAGWVVSFTLLLTVPGVGHAQVFWGGEYERAWRPGAYVPRDGMSYTTWYSYDNGPSLFFTGVTPQYVRTLDSLDRAQRASEIGLKYQSPWNPYGKVPVFNRLFGYGSYEQFSVTYPGHHDAPPAYTIPPATQAPVGSAWPRP